MLHVHKQFYQEPLNRMPALRFLGKGMYNVSDVGWCFAYASMLFLYHS